jgi:hypothetical protein
VTFDYTCIGYWSLHYLFPHISDLLLPYFIDSPKPHPRAGGFETHGSCLSCLATLSTNSSSFSDSVGWPFHSIDSVLQCTKVFNFDVQFHLLFSFDTCFWCHSQDITAKLNVLVFPLCFLLSIFMVLAFLFAFIQFKLIFVYSISV